MKFNTVFPLLIIATIYTALATAEESMTEAAIRERTMPFGSVRLEGQKPPQAPTEGIVILRSGKEIYENVCKVCHESGVAGAPKWKDNQDWEVRKKKGLKVLLDHALKGYNFMPPRGTCQDCSDEEIKNAVEYLIGQ
jgi:cytochrome c5